MNPTSDRPERSTARNYLRAGGALAAALLALNLVAAVRHKAEQAFAAPVATLTIVKGTNPGAGGLLTSGGSADVFAFQVPSTPTAPAACTGDGTKGYRIQTFIVSANVDPATLAFDAAGPSPSSTGATVRLPLFDSGNPVVDLNPALTTGALANIPTFSFAISGFSAALLPNGTYTMGLACTLDGPTGKTLDKYWSVKIDIAANPNDVPSGFGWTLNTGVPPTPTTTTAAPTTTVAPTVPPTPAPTTTVAPTVPPTTAAPTTTVAPTVPPTVPPTTAAPTTTVAPTVPPTTAAPTTTVAPTVPPTTAAPTTTTTAPVTTTTAPVTTTTMPTTTTTMPGKDDENERRDRKDRGDDRGRRGRGRGRSCDKPEGAGHFDDGDHHRGRERFVAI